ncbi:MAG TPA: NAD-glutamate dehydrogenase domain-containing protein, partial [Candidatus Lustribacter sp.]|nr:NAD-glutamate dehydrogenase domain-containing protein [Candidatus Lustribacter sp.]
PRARYNTPVRLKIESLLREAFHAVSVDYTTRVTESSLARLHFVVRVRQGEVIPDVDEPGLTRAIVEAARTWDEDLAEAARAEYGEEGAARLMGLYSRAFPEAYKEDFGPRVAVADVRFIESLTALDSTGLNMYQEPGAPSHERRFKLYRRGPLSLTQILPIFTHMGVEVIDERPYQMVRSDGALIHIYDFGLRAGDAERWGGSAHRDVVRGLFHDAVHAVWSGQAESDGFNALVLGAGLTWRQVVVLRAVAKYLRQTQSRFSQDYVEAALTSNPTIARRLVVLFETRFDPARFGQDPAGRSAAQASIVASLMSDLDAVKSLDHDRIIRALLGVVTAGLRTNYFQLDAAGAAKSYISLKLNPKEVPDLPAPRPAYEIWVYSPRVEGVHLRFGKVARGGLRWSDRREDFRTEVLGLVKAQMVKNSVIVPTGSKGGFFAKNLPDPAVDREAWLAEGIASYKLLISGLLDLTDNRVSGRIIAPVDLLWNGGIGTYLKASTESDADIGDRAN